MTDDTKQAEPEDQAVDSLAELSRRMAEAAREVRPVSVSLKGITVTGEWPEATKHQP